MYICYKYNIRTFHKIYLNFHLGGYYFTLRDIKPCLHVEYLNTISDHFAGGFKFFFYGAYFDVNKLIDKY